MAWLLAVATEKVRAISTDRPLLLEWTDLAGEYRKSLD
jgi:hypothetical protein